MAADPGRSAVERGATLVGGRPCGACGQLADAAAGRFNALGIFYCAVCAPAWTHGPAADNEQALKQRVFLRSRAERSIREGEDGTLMACLGLLPDLCTERLEHKRTLLHIAAALGRTQAVRALLETFRATYGLHVELGQALELYQDDFGATAGEYALAGGHQEAFDALVEIACGRPRPSNFCSDRNKAYVKQKLKYEGDVLLDDTGGGVMMGWEDPLMAKHAEAIVPVVGRGSVLNVGFGLGIVDGYLQERSPTSHTIVEAHPDVYAEMCRRGWPDKPGVRIVFGRWQDVLEQVVELGPFDGVFFDTWAEMYGDMQGFFARMPQLLRPGARFSFFNGLSDNNIFAQAISCHVAQIDLARVGLACLFQPVKLGEIDDAEWQKVVNKYWSLETYYVPVAVLMPDDGDDNEDDGGAAARLDFSLPCGAKLRPTAVHVDDHVGFTLDTKLERAREAGAAIGF